MMKKYFSQDHLKDVWTVLFQSGKDFLNDNGTHWAAAISYYTLLSLFPLLLAAVAISAYFVDRQWAIEQGTSLIGNFLPGGEEQIRQVVESAIQARGTVSFFSLLTLLWSGSRVFGVITKALNIAYDASEPYSFFKRVLVEFLMMLTIGLLFILALSSGFLINFLTNVVNIPGLQGNWIWRVLDLALSPVLLAISVFLIYLYVPRRTVKWWAALVGAIVFTTLFLVAQPLFTGYIRRFANYNLVYGPLAIVIILVIWTWLVANLLLIGGEIVSHIQDLVIEQKSVEEVTYRHERRDPTNPKHEQEPATS